jgi:hypothetical protein
MSNACWSLLGASVQALEKQPGLFEHQLVSGTPGAHHKGSLTPLRVAQASGSPWRPSEPESCKNNIWNNISAAKL